MPSPVMSGYSTLFLIGLGMLSIITGPSSIAAAVADPLDDALMNQAIGYLGIVRGQDLRDDEASWLKQQ